MLNKASGGAAAASLMGCDPQPPSPPTSKLTAHAGNGGRPSSLLLSPRSLFSVDAASSMAPASMAEQSKNPPCSGPRNPPSGGGGGGRPGSSQCNGGGIGNRAAGLASVLVAGEADGGDGVSKNGRVLLGMRLRVQLPPPPPGKGCGAGDPPGSPIEFGVKNRDAQLALLSPVQRSPLSSAARRSEVELAEDYTCVIARGPKPRTTHIFEDRVVESPAGAGDGGAAACCLLSSCGGCKKDALLQHRDEKSFCSSQFHHEEVLFGKRIGDSPDASVKLKP